MEIKFKCPKCGSKQRAERELAGTKVACPDCGQALRVPRPREVSTTPRFVDDESVGAAPRTVAGSPMSATEVFGFREAPAPPPKLGVDTGDGIFAWNTPAPAGSSPVDSSDKLPSRSHYRPMSESKKRRLAKESARRDRKLPSYAGAGIGISFGAILTFTLFGLRIYRTMTRFDAAVSGPAFSASVDHGVSDDPKVQAAAVDREVRILLAKPGGGEALDWLDTTKHPKHFVWEMSIANAREMVRTFIEKGAVRVTVVDPSEAFGKIAAVQFAIELPSDPASRGRCIEYYRSITEDDEVVDVGQKYLLYASD